MWGRYVNVRDRFRKHTQYTAIIQAAMWGKILALSFWQKFTYTRASPVFYMGDTSPVDPAGRHPGLRP